MQIVELTSGDSYHVSGLVMVGPYLARDKDRFVYNHILVGKESLVPKMGSRETYDDLEKTFSNPGDQDYLEIQVSPLFFEHETEYDPDDASYDDYHLLGRLMSIDDKGIAKMEVWPDFEFIEGEDASESTEPGDEGHIRYIPLRFIESIYPVTLQELDEDEEEEEEEMKEKK